MRQIYGTQILSFPDTVFTFGVNDLLIIKILSSLG